MVSVAIETYFFYLGEMPKRTIHRRLGENDEECVDLAPTKTPRRCHLFVVGRFSQTRVALGAYFLRVTIEPPNDGRFGVVVGILAYYARGRGFNSRTVQTFVMCMSMSVCIGSGCFYV
jgi:hypothetical protein